MKKKFQYSSGFLFSDSGFLTGAGSAINIAGNYYDFATSESEAEADSKALKNDWGVVGQDIESAISASKSQNILQLQDC